MLQNKLFFDTVYDAIGADVISAGGYKIVSGKLWPNMKQASAYARLKACLEEHKDEKLDPEEVHAIAKMAKAAVGQSNYLIYTGTELHCEYKDVEPEDELTTLLRAYMEDKRTQAKREERIDGMIERMGLRAVK